MPQVPESFLPSATTSPLGVSPMSAEGVQPMRNAAPGQMEQAGADVQKLGAETHSIGERIQSQLDNAMAKQAETGFLNKVIGITAGDGTAANPGYLNLRGQAAINGYQDAAAAVAKAKQEGQDGLADPFQKSMYNRVTSQHLMSFGREMADHRFQQTAQYSGEAAVDRANAYASSASTSAISYGLKDGDGNPTGDFFRNMHVAEQETLHAVEIMKGAPEGSAQATAALVNLHTQIGVGALSQMMDARMPYSKVQAVFSDMKAKDGSFSIRMQQADGSMTSVPGLDDRAQETLGRMVKAYSDQKSTLTAVTQHLSDAVRSSQGKQTSSTGTPDYQFPVKGATVTAQHYDPEQGGVTVNVPAGSNIQAPADGKVTQAGRDAENNFVLKIAHADGSITSFTGLTAANVKVGDQVQRGEMVATSGAADQKTPSVLWSLTSKTGQNVDPSKAGLAPVDLTRITDEKVLASALDSMRRQVTDPDLQQQATREMELIVRSNQQMQNAGDTQLFKQASDIFYSHSMNWRAIPPSIFSQLPAERQHQFKEAQTEEVLKNYHQGQAFKEMGETDQVANFLSNPDQLTPANVDSARANLSNSTYLQLMGKATALENNPKGVVEAQGVGERVKYFAGSAGVNMSPRTPADKQTYNTLMFKVQQDIDQIKGQNKGKATGEQVDKAIQSELIQHTLTVPRSAWNPLAITGLSPNSSSKKFSFQLPGGATHVVPGSDGNMHYTDGKSDLGIVK